MSGDPVERLPEAFGRVLARYRSERKLTAEALATAAGLSGMEVKSLEHGSYPPTLKDLFRIARAFGEQPTIMLCHVISAWRADPTDILHQSRPSEFSRLFRLGYHHKPGDFRELFTSYYSVAEAAHAAGILNAQRHSRGVALLDTVAEYVRLNSVSLRPEAGSGGAP